MPSDEPIHLTQDDCDNISALVRYCADWGQRKGWNDTRTFDTDVALFHTEISEAYEEYRNHHSVQEVYWSQDAEGNRKPEGVGIEIVDVMIRIFHWAARNGINLAYLLELKLNYNETRSFRHGGKKT